MRFGSMNLFYSSVKMSLANIQLKWFSSCWALANEAGTCSHPAARYKLQILYWGGRFSFRKIKMKKHVNWSGNLLVIPAEFITCMYSLSKLTFLLLVVYFDCFWFAGSSKKLMYTNHPFIILSRFAVPPFCKVPFPNNLGNFCLANRMLAFLLPCHTF